MKKYLKGLGMAFFGHTDEKEFYEFRDMAKEVNDNLDNNLTFTGRKIKEIYMESYSAFVGNIAFFSGIVTGIILSCLGFWIVSLF